MSTPKYLLNLALALLLIFAVLPAKAQTVYPVRTIATLTGTMPLSLDGFVSQEGKLQVHVIVDDAAIERHAVRLRLTMVSSDIRLTTSPNYKPQPVYLDGGAMQLLTASDLADLFNPNNLLFEGITKAQYNKTGRLPEGVYRVTIDVLDYYRNVVISRSTAAIGMMYLTKAPLLTFPIDNTEIDIATSPQIRFSWMTYHAANPEADVVHKFRLWEVKPAGRSTYEVINVMKPMYEQEVTGTSLILSPDDPLLTQGASYVWQVQAVDANNKVVYQNDGKSQAMVFRYGKSCETPQPRIVKLHTTGGQIAWDGALTTQQYRIDYRKTDTTEWTTDIATQNTYDFKELTDNTTYECTVTALCSGEESDPSPVLQFKTNRTVDYTCGANNINFDLSNKEPLPSLYRFAEFKAGDFTIEVDNVTGSNGLFKGDGYALVPYLGFMKMRVTFDGITVNTDRRMIAGKVEFVYDEATGMVFSLYKSKPKTAEEIAYEFLKAGVTEVVTTTQPVGSVTIKDSTVTITLADGSTQQVTTTKKGDTVGILSPNAETAYVADTGSGMVFQAQLPIKGEAANSSTVATPAQSGQYGCGAVLSPSSIQKGGFDAVGNGKTKPNNYFRFSKAGQPIAWKSLPAGGTDYVEVNVSGNCDIDSMRYLRESGLPVPSADSGKGKRLLLTGTSHGDEETLTVALSTKELQRDSTYRQTLTEAGALGLVSYNPKVCNLRIVAVGGAKAPSSAVDIKTTLDKLFAPALVTWSVTIEKPLTVDGITPAGFSTTGLDEASRYTGDMNKVIDAYKKGNNRPANTYVLFFVEATKSDKLGYMPLTGNYGFIFDLGTNIELLAHELSHGAFNLKHTFSDKAFWQLTGPAPKFAEGSTQNLMDYSTGGIELWKYQWDLIHNPETIVLGSLDEEEGAATIPSGLYTKSYINKIRCLKQKGETSFYDDSFIKHFGDYNYDAWSHPTLLNDEKYGNIWVWYTCNNPEAIDISNIQKKGSYVYVGKEDGCQLKFLTRDNNFIESEYLAQTLIDYLNVSTTTYNSQFYKHIIDISGKSTDVIVSEINNMQVCMAEKLSVEWRFFFLEKIIQQDANLSDDEIYAIYKILTSNIQALEAIELLKSIKDKGYDCQLIDKTKSINSSNYELIVMALTKLYLAQDKNQILEYGKNVDAENFYIWQPMGNMKDLSNTFYNDPNLRTMWNSIHHTIYTYKVNYQPDCRFKCNATAFTGSMVGYSVSELTHFYLNPLETISVYFASKNKQLGVEGYTVTMPGIFFAWLIEQGEAEAKQPMKDVAIFVASCYFPITNINKALKAKSYFSLAWNSILLAKEMSDFMLSNDRFRIRAKELLGDGFITQYMTISQLYDCTMLFKDFTEKEYKSVAIELIDQWNGISKDKKTELSKDFPELYNKLIAQITKIQLETTL